MCSITGCNGVYCIEYEQKLYQPKSEANLSLFVKRGWPRFYDAGSCLPGMASTNGLHYVLPGKKSCLCTASLSKHVHCWLFQRNLRPLKSLVLMINHGHILRLWWNDVPWPGLPLMSNWSLSAQMLRLVHVGVQASWSTRRYEVPVMARISTGRTQQS